MADGGNFSFNFPAPLRAIAEANLDPVQVPERMAA